MFTFVLSIIHTKIMEQGNSISPSDSPDTSRKVSSHHPQSLPYASSRGYGAYLRR